VDEKTLSSLSAIDRHAFHVGLLAVTWAFVEGSLDLCCVVAFHHLGGSTREDELPRSLGRKFTFLRQTLMIAMDNTITRQRCVDLIDCAVEASDFRHLCIHGLPLDDGPNFIVQMFERLPTDLVANEHRITLKDIAQAQVEGSMLLFGMTHLLLRLCDLAHIPGQSELHDQLPSDLLQHRNATKRAKRIFVSLQGLGVA